MKTLVVLAASLMIGTSCLAMDEEGQNCHEKLNWRHRPQVLQAKIDNAFDSIKENLTSCWGVHNGDKSYEMCGIKEYELIAALFKNLLSQQKEVNILDLGCGDFQWGRQVSRYINNIEHLRDDLTINIFSIRGEKSAEQIVKKDGRCTLHELGHFKIEELESDFHDETKHLRYNLENKVDLIISQWTYRHFADPVGTFAQTYNLLRPRTGLLLLDGFWMFSEDEKEEKNIKNTKIYLVNLFKATKAPFLMHPYNHHRGLNRFLLKRPDEALCQLPLSYRGICEVEKHSWQVGSGCITQFQMPASFKELKVEFKKIQYDSPQLLGDKMLYNWLINNDIHPYNTYTLESLEYGGEL